MHFFFCSWFGLGVGDVEDRRGFFLLFDERGGEREDRTVLAPSCGSL